MMNPVSTFQHTKQQLIHRGLLFEDPDFPANVDSLGRNIKNSAKIQWLRPRQIEKDPQFQVDGMSHYDLHQGGITDCYLLAAAACLAVTSPQLLARVVPPDQNFTRQYAGIFRFNFWRYSQWIEVIVDDRLPTINNRLIFAHNKTPGLKNEFWGALLEKAFAKLNGSYENIRGGYVNEALVDLTGGISERVDLQRFRNSPSSGLFDLLIKWSKMSSILACDIESDKLEEEDLGNGLYGGHAYSITKLARIKYRGKETHLIRLLNPWGHDEWEGDWSDKSNRWKHVPEAIKNQLGYHEAEEGEFWMLFEDWLEEFEELAVCHLTPDAFLANVMNGTSIQYWRELHQHGQWIRGISAGGCGNKEFDPGLFWMNPQFSINVSAADDSNRDGKVTVIMSLAQKYKTVDDNHFISFKIFKVKQGNIVRHSPGYKYTKNDLEVYQKPKDYMNIREVTGHFLLDPGHYVIIPSTFEPHKEGQFFLRIFAETDLMSS